MSSYNRVLLIGNVTKDPELRYTPNGKAVLDLGLAVNEVRGSGADQKKETTFVDITTWDQQAETIAKYVRKGDPLFIEGRLKLDSWEGQNGEHRSKLKVVLSQFQFLGKREGQAATPAPRDEPVSREPAPQGLRDDEIPF